MSLAIVYRAPTFAGGSFSPPADALHDLGSESLGWRNIWGRNEGQSILYGDWGVKGSLTQLALGTPPTPTLATVGTAGATTYGYRIVATVAGQDSIRSAEATIATGNATLDGTNFIRITWTAVSGATGYKVYRTTGGATQGLISTLTTALTLTLDDTGLAGDGVSPATTDRTGRWLLVAGEVGFPALAPVGDLNTGMWFPAADTIALSTAGAEVIRVDSVGLVTLSQGAADGLILKFTSSDVATGLTTGTSTVDVATADYAAFSKFAAATGGLLVQVLGENAAVTTNLLVESYGGQASATKSTAGRSLTEIYVSQHDGANALADIAADGNAFGIRGRRGGADVTLFLVDEDGDLWMGGTQVLLAAATEIATQTTTNIITIGSDIVRVGSGAGEARLRLRGFYAASPADPPASESDIIVVDTGAAQVLRVRYNDAGVMKVGDLALV